MCQVWDLGNGPGIDTIDLSFDGALSGALVFEDCNNVAPPLNTKTSLVCYTGLSLNTYYHIAAVLSQPNFTLYTAAWTVYVNGQATLTVPSSQGTWPLPITRPKSYLGKSDWSNSDPNIVATYDSFRIYDYVLSATQVQQLAANYGLLTIPPPPSNATFSSTGSGDAAAASIVPRAPVFQANFSQPPTSLIGTASAWTWANSDPADSGNTATLHQGVAIFNGEPASYIDLTTTTGPNSCGYALPTFGGLGYYGPGNPSQGWSVEVVAKLAAADWSSQNDWAKLLNWGDSSPPVVPGNNFALSMDGGDTGRLLLQQYSSNAQLVNGQVELFSPQNGSWYHIVVGMQAVGSGATGGAGPANWFVYLNGQPLAYANAIVAGATLTAVQSANYPPAVSRPYCYIAKSDWSDPPLLATVDALRVYDYLLQPSTVQALAAAYGLNISSPQQSYAYPTSAETQAMLAVVPTAPIFNAPFSVDPATSGTIGSSPAYTWMLQDPQDSPQLQRLHQGLIFVNNSYIDLSTASGPNSVGLVMPIFGLPGSGSVGGTQGLSFEVVVKFGAIPNGWGKVSTRGV